MRHNSEFNKLRAMKPNRPPVISVFEHLIAETKNLMYEKLSMSAEQEASKQDKLSHIIAKEQKTSAEVAGLKEDLEKTKKERLMEVSKRNDQIRKLKGTKMSNGDDLRDIKRNAEDTNGKFELKYAQKKEADLILFNEKEQLINIETNELKAKLDNDIAKDREEEALGRKKKFKIELECENWIHKYDQDMGEKQVEIDDITTLFNEENGHLEKLTTRYNFIQREYEDILAEKLRFAEQIKQNEEKLIQRDKAATKIQAAWRGRRTRILLKKMKVTKCTDARMKKSPRAQVRR